MNESAPSIARDTRHSPNHYAFASPVHSLHIRVCPVSIGPLVVEISDREPTRVLLIFGDSRNSFRHFSHVEAMGKTVFFQHVSRTRHAPQRNRLRSTRSGETSPATCQNFTPLRQAVWHARDVNQHDRRGRRRRRRTSTIFLRKINCTPNGFCSF